MEKRPSNMGRREFLRKLGGAVAGVALSGSALASIGDKKFAGSNDAEKAEKNKSIINEIFTQKEIFPNEGEDFSKKMDYWYKRHIPGGSNYNALKAGWDRLLNSDGKKQSDLETAFNIFNKENVPLDLLFLAITESYWDKNAFNAGSKATGLWQFIPATAERFGLKDSYNLVKSTEAACKYLKELHKLALICSDEAEVVISESDAWLWAFFAYNRGEGYVLRTPKGSKKGSFFTFNGDINEYIKKCKVKESINYGPKIMAIAKASEEMFMQETQVANK